MPSLRLERAFLTRGYRLIAGVDEVGRGAWAGPVMAAAVILPLDRPGLTAALRGVDDSKQLTPRQREDRALAILEVGSAVGIGSADPDEIDREGIAAATRMAMARAVAVLDPQPEALLIDAVNLQTLIALPQRFLNFGDSISLSIAAASIIAKVARDKYMTILDERYPVYGFGQHKGYGTAYHRAALRRFGVCAVHRKSYAPVAAAMVRALKE